MLITTQSLHVPLPVLQMISTGGGSDIKCLCLLAVGGQLEATEADVGGSSENATADKAEQGLVAYLLVSDALYPVLQRQ